MSLYYLQPVHMQDIDIAMNLINDGKEYLKDQGIDQWQTGYPDIENIRQDIVNNRGYFITDGIHKLAYLCIDFGGEPAYKELKGAWKSSLPYAVIHRLAAGKKNVGNGLSASVIRLTEELCKKKGIYSIRADTDKNNTIMQHILKKHGFQYCGTVWFAGSEKIAFEKLLYEKG